jgi:hypothetical protein
MVFVVLAGVVVLATLWTVARWRTGVHPADPAARVLAVLGLAGLGVMVGLGPWSWIGARHGLAFWGFFGVACVVFAADWRRQRRRSRQAGGSEGDSLAAARDRSP